MRNLSCGYCSSLTCLLSHWDPCRLLSMLAVAAGVLRCWDQSTNLRDAYRTVLPCKITCTRSELDPNPRSHLITAQNILFHDDSDTNWQGQRKWWIAYLPPLPRSANARPSFVHWIQPSLAVLRFMSHSSWYPKGAWSDILQKELHATTLDEEMTQFRSDKPQICSRCVLLTKRDEFLGTVCCR